MFNGEIISYSIRERPVLKQVMDMLDQAFEKIPDHSGLIFHSDQGWQYQHRHYQKRLADKEIIQSCQEKGIVWIMPSWKASLSRSQQQLSNFIPV